MSLRGAGEQLQKTEASFEKPLPGSLTSLFQLLNNIIFAFLTRKSLLYGGLNICDDHLIWFDFELDIFFLGKKVDWKLIIRGSMGLSAS